MKIYNKKQLAKEIGVSVVTLDRYRKEGKIPHRKIGSRVVFTDADMIAFLDSCYIPAVNFPSERERMEIKKSYHAVTQLRTVTG